MLFIASLCGMGVGDAAAQAQGQAQSGEPSARPAPSLHFYQQGTQALSEKRYPEGIQGLQQAYFAGGDVLLLASIAVAHRTYAQDPATPRSEVPRIAREGLDWARRYLEQDGKNIECDFLEVIIPLRELAVPHSAAVETGEPSPLDYALSELRQAQLRNPNPDLVYCLSRAQGERARDVQRGVGPRLDDATQAVKGYRTYRKVMQRTPGSSPHEYEKDLAELEQLEARLRAEAARQQPVYKKTWFRVMMGGIGVAVAGAIITCAIGCGGTPASQLPVDSSQWQPRAAGMN